MADIKVEEGTAIKVFGVRVGVGLALRADSTRHFGACSASPSTLLVASLYGTADNLVKISFTTVYTSQAAF